MYRKLFGALTCGLVLCAVVMADDVKGKIVKVDVDNNKITVAVDGKETEYAVADDAKFPKVKDKDKNEKDGKLKDVKTKVEKSAEKAKADGKDAKGVDVVVTVEKKDGKDVVTKIEYPKGKGKTPDKKTEEKK